MARRWSLVVLILVVACGGENGGDRTDGPGVFERPDTDQEASQERPGSGPTQRTSWLIDTGEKQLEGHRAFVGAGDGRLAIHLVNRDGVNLHFVVADDGSPERTVTSAYYAVGRGKACQLMPSEPPFAARFEESGPASLKGSFTGQLACEDFSRLAISGRFSVPRPATEEES